MGKLLFKSVFVKMVYTPSGLIPARFLTLVAHLIITVMLLWSRDENVKSSLPAEYSALEYSARDTQLAVGLYVAVGLTSVEMASFLFGITMFMSTTAVISILCHSSACVLLSHFLFDAWDCRLYWCVLALCSVLPVIVDATSAATVLLFRKY